jgi:hypothetical protein
LSLAAAKAPLYSTLPRDWLVRILAVETARVTDTIPRPAILTTKAPTINLNLTFFIMGHCTTPPALC